MTLRKSDWQRKHKLLKRELQREEFSGWAEQDFVNYILELRQENELLEAQIEQLEKKAEELKPAPVQATLSEKDYRQRWSYPTKIVFILQWQKKPLTSIEIHNFLLKLDHRFSDLTDPKKKISVDLSRSVKNGRIKSIKQPGIKELLFTLPD